MDERDKREFLTDLSGNILKTLLAKVHKTPENWDGHELRQWLIDQTATASSQKMEDKRSSRRKAYQNDLIVRSL